ncbi:MULTISPECIES: HypC/HybG/HupF family hydrogenase formation chaperone [Stappiaceae]|jgi:hydrogenase expression/formation protein HypC|uniref:Hydrogenase maturation factor HypC n=1 Tax=Roseibium alexandrii (strain DSM 17067 / NCIMB 14079 / DFL-11) TaxID=244592 RepID=A0A5E8GY54_ROSAD|nr:MULTISPECIES: HypC/HybG/HupF family hydrogenase formation chaperone [Stappiaceae]EEE44282.1 hydrogenase assembly chaperone HypC/HupF [Roseibium alexandrii DFL-11]MBO9418162.1 HypC/HybG/HupF family hydrogenase formation chaperone [Labrenzia sp. R4_2]OJJ13506.1 hydrogenase [Alphaproteobacteria bacterium AO1-B]
MCLAIPAKITELDGDDMAVVALEGIKKRISTALVEDLAVGDYVLVHVGYALHKVSPDEAARTLQLMAEAGVLQDELDEMTGADQ